MKHLRQFNESLSNKILVEDMLIEFQDSGELKDNIIVNEFNDGTMNVLLDFVDATGFKKLELLDRIIKRLNRKFKFIYTNKEYLVIDIVSKNMNKAHYINFNLFEAINKSLDRHLKDLHKFKSDTYKGYIFYAKVIAGVKHVVLTHFKGVSEVRDCIYADFWYEDLYMLDYNDSAEIIKKGIEDRLGIKTNMVNKYDSPKYKDLTPYNESKIFESSIGSEAIRVKWYSDMPKSIFYKIVNIDPTSVRKKDFSKPGKYTKWLLREYKNRSLSDELLSDKSWVDKLNYKLFVFSTGWFKYKAKSSNIKMENDIFKLKLYEFNLMMSEYINDYEAQTEESKYDVIYSDHKIDILVPLNFSASFETAQNTEWCSKTMSSYSSWNDISIMFRIIPKSKSLDKVKLTWQKNGQWHLSCSKYPEINGYNTSPFKKDGDIEIWLKLKKEYDVKNADWDKWVENSKNIYNTMILLSDDAKKLIEKYYKEHNK